MTIKRICIILGIIFNISLLMLGCVDENEISNFSVKNEGNKENHSQIQNELLYITNSDQKTTYTEPIYVDLTKMNESYVIESAGEYVLTGITNKPLIVQAHDEIVHIFLDGVTIDSDIGSAMNIRSAGKVIITLVEDSENIFLDSAYYEDEEANAAIYAGCDLTINGTGMLNVCGYYKDAIHTKDVFKLLGGQVHLQAKRCGIKGNDGIVLSPVSLEIESEKNGCETTNANNEEKGSVKIAGGKISVIAGEYAIVAVADVYIEAGEIYFNSVIDSIYAEGQQYIVEGTIVNE